MPTASSLHGVVLGCTGVPFLLTSHRTACCWACCPASGCLQRYRLVDRVARLTAAACAGSMKAGLAFAVLLLVVVSGTQVCWF